MPLYEYRCRSCSYSFEKIQSFSASPESVCPKCAGELFRPMTAPALQFKGAGWYINDYSSKGKATAESGDSAAGAESKPDVASGAASGATTEATKSADAPAASPAASTAPTPAASTTPG